MFKVFAILIAFILLFSGGIALYLLKQARAERLLRDRLWDEVEQSVATERKRETEIKEGIAREKQIPWPAETPTLTAAEMLAKLKPQIAAKVEEKAPIEMTETIYEKANAKFGPLKVGQDVRIRVLISGRYREVAGRLDAVSADTVRVDGKTYRLNDVAEDDRLRLRPALAHERMREYVMRRHADFKEAREKERQRAAVELMAGRGFLYLPAYAEDLLADGAGPWATSTDVMDSLFERHMKAFEQAAERRVFEESGFVLSEGVWCRNSRWRQLLDKVREP